MRVRLGLSFDGVAILLGGTIHSLPKPARHHHVIRKLVEDGHPTPIDGEQGFVLSDGTFVNRRDGYVLARELGHIINPTPGDLDPENGPVRDLFSEDLW